MDGVQKTAEQAAHLRPWRDAQGFQILPGKGQVPQGEAVAPLQDGPGPGAAALQIWQAALEYPGGLGGQVRLLELEQSENKRLSMLAQQAL